MEPPTENVILDNEVANETYVGDESMGQTTCTQELAAEEISLMLDGIDNFLVNLKEESGGNAEPDAATDVKWRFEKENLCTSISEDYVDKRNLQKMKMLCDRTLQKARAISTVQGNLSANECIGIFLNRDWYFLLENHIRVRLDTSKPACSLPEVLELCRVWLLQMLEKQTADTLFKDQGSRWGYVRRLRISQERYKTLMKAMNSGAHELGMDEGNSEDEKCNTAVWGNLLEQEDLPHKLEEHVGNVGRNFVFDGISDVTIDDDKLRHSSPAFREVGLQMTGFRGSRIGPVMNGLATVQTGLLHSIHFNRHGDNPVSIVSALLQNIGYGQATFLKKKLDVLVMLDRGYNYHGVNILLSRLGMRFLGTHSERFDNWPFNSGEQPLKHQKVIPLNCARGVYVAQKKQGNKNVWAHCYRNGSKLIGNVFTTEPEVGHWVITRHWKNQYKAPDLSHEWSKTLFNAWSIDTVEMTAKQAITPWFELRGGMLTGTTTKNVIRVLKFEILDSADQELVRSASSIFSILGLNTKRLTQEVLDGKSVAAKRKAYHALGFTGTPTIDIVDAALLKQHPSPSLVFQRLVNSWCMTPIKRKSKAVYDSFAHGKAAEPKAQSALAAFLHERSDITLHDIWTPGLLRRRRDLAIGASPDALAVISCPVNVPSNEKKGTTVLRSFLAMNQQDHFGSYVCKDDTSYYALSAVEYKHKSAISTVALTRELSASLRETNGIAMLDLGDESSIAIFQCYVPEMDYRFQVMHEALCSNCRVILFTVASTQIDYIVVLLFPRSAVKEYNTILQYIQRKHLYWLFKENTEPQEFDKALTHMPTYKVKYGYAGDLHTLKCRLQMMMCLHDLREEIDQPIAPGANLVPAVVALWNALKGAIDDISKTLAHNLAKWGKIAPTTVLVVRCFSAMLYNAWRLYSLQSTRTYLTQQCDSYASYQKARLQSGGTFEQFLDKIFQEMMLPKDIAPAQELNTIQCPLPPERPKSKKSGHPKRSDYNSDEWMAFRLNTHTQEGQVGHVSVSLKAFYRSKRSFCAYCSKATYEKKGDLKGSSICLYSGGAGKKPSFGCLACCVPLCRKSPCKGTDSCFVRWHTVHRILLEPIAGIKQPSQARHATMLVNDVESDSSVSMSDGDNSKSEKIDKHRCSPTTMRTCLPVRVKQGHDSCGSIENNTIKDYQPIPARKRASALPTRKRGCESRSEKSDKHKCSPATMRTCLPVRVKQGHDGSGGIENNTIKDYQPIPARKRASALPTRKRGCESRSEKSDKHKCSPATMRTCLPVRVKQGHDSCGSIEKNTIKDYQPIPARKRASALPTRKRGCESRSEKSDKHKCSPAMSLPVRVKQGHDSSGGKENISIKGCQPVPVRKRANVLPTRKRGWEHTNDGNLQLGNSSVTKRIRTQMPSAFKQEPACSSDAKRTSIKNALRPSLNREANLEPSARKRSRSGMSINRSATSTTKKSR